LKNFESNFHFKTFEKDMLFSIESENRDVILVTYDKINLMILGVNYYHAGVGELWLVPSKYVSRFPFQTVKITKTLIEGCLLAERKMRRLFFYVNNSWEKGHKWAKLLGFQVEGIAKAYGENNEDFALYAKVRVS
jgi:hypothetical protein